MEAETVDEAAVLLDVPLRTLYDRMKDLGYWHQSEVWWQIGGPGLMAMLIGPVIFWILNWVARVTGYPYLPDRSFE